MKTKHTPGTWTQETPGNVKGNGWTKIVSDNGLIVARVLPLHPSKRLQSDFDEEGANALLISAAPDLLEACRSILRDYGYDSSIRAQLAPLITRAEGK